MTPAWKWASAATSAVLAGVLTAISISKWGIGVSPDSISYLHAAGTIADGDGIRTLRGEVQTVWPPMYASLLALGPLVGVGAAQWAAVLNITLVAVLAGGSSLWVGNQVRRVTTLLAAVLVFGCSAPLLSVSRMAWSETLFATLVALSLAALMQARVSPSRRWVIIAGITTGAALLTRTAGLPLLPVGMAAVAIGRNGGMRRRVADAALFAGTAVAGPALWAIRNMLVGGEAVPPAYESSIPLTDNVSELLTTLGSWLVPSSVPTAVVTAVGTALLAIAVWVLIRRRPRAATLPAAYGIAYVIFLIVATTYFTANTPYDRYLVPAAVPLLVAALLWLDAQRGRPAIAASVITLILAAGGATAAWRGVDHARAAGAGFYSTDRWQTSELVDELRTSNVVPLSNFPEVVTYLAGLEADHGPRDRPFSAATERWDWEEYLNEHLADGPVTYAWFSLGSRGMYIAPELLRDAGYEMEPAGRYNDGSVWLITDRPRVRLRMKPLAP